MPEWAKLWRKTGQRDLIASYKRLQKDSDRAIIPVVEDSLVAQMIKCLPIMLETQVPSLGQEDPLEKEMETHSSTLAWRIRWMEESDGLQSTGSQRIGHN